MKNFLNIFFILIIFFKFQISYKINLKKKEKINIENIKNLLDLSVNTVLNYCVFNISFWFENYWIIIETPTTVQINLKTLENTGRNY